MEADLPMNPQSSDVLVIGAGLVGAAIAWGLARAGVEVVMLDEHDAAYRASRGNFGLVWVQGKGAGFPIYARWTRRSSDRWAGFADELERESALEVGFRRPGGVVAALDEDELAQEAALLERVRSESGASGFEFEVLEHARLAELCPGLGAEVVGGTYCPHDGDTNPLRLMHALHAAFVRAGGHYLGDARVACIEPMAGGGFRVRSARGEFEAGKLVVAAGLGSRVLAAQVGLEMPVRPVQGQCLITERAPWQRLPLPTLDVRQVDEGGFQLGWSSDEVGMDLATRAGTLRDIARRCTRIFPYLGDLRIVRTWAALRVMTADGFPLYEQSRECPGAFGITCHSGVTLAAVHALEVAEWIRAGAIPTEFAAFSAARFDVSPAA